MGSTHSARRGLLVLLTVVTAVLVPRSPQAATPNLFFKATGAQTSVYLVGSVYLRADYYPLNPALEAAFKNSDLLVLEVEPPRDGSALVQMMRTRAMLPPGQSLDKVVSPDTFALMTKTAVGMGLALESYTQAKPWAVTANLIYRTLTRNAGFLALENHFLDLAKPDQKPVQGLETLEFQISRFDEMSAALQDRLLADTLKAMPTATETATKLADAWRSGDIDTVERLALQDLKQKPAEMYLLVERNRYWLPKIEALFNRPGRAFVVVGAAHLIGPDGLLHLLTAKGYGVEQL